jgi:hypothetical protein
MWSSQIFIFIILLIASLNINALAQADRLTTTDTTTFLEQDTTTAYQPICPYGSGPPYFTTLLAGRSAPYMSRTLFTLFNGTEAAAEGELSIETSGRDFDSVELVHSCSDFRNIPQGCSFDLVGTPLVFFPGVCAVLPRAVPVSLT